MLKYISGKITHRQDPLKLKYYYIFFSNTTFLFLYNEKNYKIQYLSNENI